MRKWVEQTWGRMFTVLSTQSSTQQGKYATARLLQIQQTGTTQNCRLSTQIHARPTLYEKPAGSLCRPYVCMIMAFFSLFWFRTGFTKQNSRRPWHHALFIRPSVFSHSHQIMHFPLFCFKLICIHFLPKKGQAQMKQMQC